MFPTSEINLIEPTESTTVPVPVPFLSVLAPTSNVLSGQGASPTPKSYNSVSTLLFWSILQYSIS